MISILFVIIGFVALIKGADYLVDGAVGFARKFHIPTLVIGMTIVAFGTSAPEAAVSITAALQGSNEISFSNVVGSNIFNLLAVGGISAIIRFLPIKGIAIKRDYPFHLLITVALLVLCADSFLGGEGFSLSRGDGIILLLFMAVYMYINISDSINNNEPEEEVEIIPVWKSCLFFAIGLIGIIIGGKLVVEGSTSIARMLGVSDTLIGLTIVALGTSLPELVTSAVACHRGEADLAWGNIVGSNIFNILFVLGLSATIRPFGVNIESIYDTLILLGFSTVVYFAVAPKKKVTMGIGICMLIAYIIYTAYIIVR